MEFETYVRKPFTIEAIQVNEENIEELSKLVGTLRKKRNGEFYIQVNPQLVPSIPAVYLGFWITKMDYNIRCYSGRTFAEQFVKSTPDIDAWVEFMNQKQEENAPNST